MLQEILWEMLWEILWEILREILQGNPAGNCAGNVGNFMYLFVSLLVCLQCKLRCIVRHVHSYQEYDQCLEETRICNRQVDCEDKSDEKHEACVIMGREDREVTSYAIIHSFFLLSIF